MINKDYNYIADLGRLVLNAVADLGRFMMFVFDSLLAIVTPKYYLKQTIKQFIEVGFFSLPVIGLTALFTGMVLALQSYTGFDRFNASGAVASVVVLSITRELAPVLTALMVAGRVGAAIAAELGTMRVTEQIDALYTLSVNPYHYLIAPRIIGCVLALPCLVLIADIIGVTGGYLVAVHHFHFNAGIYIHDTFANLEVIDVISGLIKAVVFGFFISIVACYNGYKSAGGAQGVGLATTTSVVVGSITVLIFDYFLTMLFFSK